MGLISKIKSLFSKPISLSTKSKDELVSMIYFSFGKVKVGTEIKIENSYRLVATHYNKVCDTLHEGTYKVDSMDMPRLFNLCRKRLLGKELKTIKTDLYYVNMKEFSHVDFKGSGKFPAKTYSGKASVRVMGEFSFIVTDSAIFMQNMCSEYAIVKNRIALRDIANIVGSDITYLLKKKMFDLSSIIKNDDELKKYLLDNLEKLEKSYGIRVTNIKIADVDAPSGYEREIQAAKDVSKIEDDIMLEAETHISGQIKEDEPVFIKVGTSMPFEENNSQNILKQDVFNNQIGNATDSQNFFVNTSPTQADDHTQYKLQKAPNLFGESDDESIKFEQGVEQSSSSLEKVLEVESSQKSQKNFDIQENEPVNTPSTYNEVINNDSKDERLKVCQCCGAKNSQDADICQVCKSKF